MDYPEQQPKKLYRARDGMFMGVCLGLARYANMDVTVVRIIVAVLAVVTAVIPAVIVYILLGLILPKEPIGL